ncbi:hypothetical protein HQ571_05545 [Candidatus Kuenenbacteria bacterium]|nr:hypothetical protein [Candidatus Kuenenbacteria bacterium]
MKRNFEFIAYLSFFMAVALALFSNTEMGMRLASSEIENAEMLATSIHEVIQHPDADIEKGISFFGDGNKPIKICGRTILVKINTVGDIGWPTVVSSVTISFIRDDDSRSPEYHFNMLI